MVAILLALLGVPLWLVAGLVLGALYHRHLVKRAPGVFRCKARLASGGGIPLKSRWRRVPMHGRWVHDVLLLSQGLALARIVPIPAVEIVAGPDKADPSRIKRLGSAPRVLTLRIDGGSTVELAAGQADELRMLGPFADRPVPPRQPMSG